MPFPQGLREAAGASPHFFGGCEKIGDRHLAGCRFPRVCVRWRASPHFFGGSRKNGDRHLAGCRFPRVCVSRLGASPHFFTNSRRKQGGSCGAKGDCCGPPAVPFFSCRPLVRRWESIYNRLSSLVHFRGCEKMGTGTSPDVVAAEFL